MSELVRTAIGEFRVDDGVDPTGLTAETFAEAMLPPDLAVTDMQRVDLTADEAKQITNGVPITPREELTPRELAMFTPDGRLLGIGKRKRGGMLWPVRVFNAAK